ncbi:hypothetical protein [Rhodomicrobium lacus]|uniref:hypothetical protein n=1 Tax=Rhodomicrobium lacus TaxID=2498452 RepID=UPI0026E1E572|nr:hypothetical protein [Rhodomicrobium lacus]WKW50252.1 hypothetical protein QMO75_13315 [Rhodomicrobium lacus]
MINHLGAGQGAGFVRGIPGGNEAGMTIVHDPEIGGEMGDDPWLWSLRESVTPEGNRQVNGFTI